MTDWDIDAICDAYLVDDDRYDPLADNTADPCPTCSNQRYVNVPAGNIGGVQAYRQQRCPTCDGGPDV